MIPLEYSARWIMPELRPGDAYVPKAQRQVPVHCAESFEEAARSAAQLFDQMGRWPRTVGKEYELELQDHVGRKKRFKAVCTKITVDYEAKEVGDGP